MQAVDWKVVSDGVHRYIKGIYMRDKIPPYIVTGIMGLTDLRWKSVFMQLMIVKHNHLTVSRAIAAKRDKIP